MTQEALVERVRRGVVPGQVLPWYAKTHTASSGTGRHTTRLRDFCLPPLPA